MVTRGDGRSINRDPIGESGGLNLYGFAGNDGINGWDVLGAAEDSTNDRRRTSGPDRLIISPSVTIIDWNLSDPDFLRERVPSSAPTYGVIVGPPVDHQSGRRR